MKNLIFIFLAFGFTMACNSSKNTTTSDRPAVNESTATNTRSAGQGQGKRPGGRPSVDEMFQRMDANGDGKLAKTEVKGHLQQNFVAIDTNKDGMLSKEEVQNAPKPKKGQGPRRPTSNQ